MESWYVQIRKSFIFRRHHCLRSSINPIPFSCPYFPYSNNRNNTITFPKPPSKSATFFLSSLLYAPAPILLWLASPLPPHIILNGMVGRRQSPLLHYFYHQQSWILIVIFRVYFFNMFIYYSLIEIWFTCHKIHPFKVYSSEDFGIFRVMQS